MLKGFPVPGACLNPQCFSTCSEMLNSDKEHDVRGVNERETGRREGKEG